MKKAKTLFISCCLVASSFTVLYGQLEVVSPGDVGIGTSTPSNIGGFDKVLDVHGNNSSQIVSTTTDGSINTGLMSTTFGDWGAVGTKTNHPFLIFSNNTSQVVLSTQGEFNIKNDIRLGSYNNKIKLSTTGSYSQANGFDFNTGTYDTYPGIIMEQGVSQSSGFYSDGDFAVIWSPGDENRLLRIYDSSSGMVEKWYLNGSGYAYTISDRNTKQNIVDVSSAMSMIKNIQGVKFNYNEEIQASNIPLSEKSTPVASPSETDSLFVINDPIIDNEQYDPSQKEYYGFIAQDVEIVFPQVVETDENGKKFISYTQFIPILVEGLKEQQLVIDSQSQDIELMREQILQLQKLLLPKDLANINGEGEEL